MNIEIKVITNAKKRAITRSDSGITVKLKALPIEGRANDELMEYLSDLFKIKRSAIKIVRGEKDRHKILSIPVTPEDLNSLFGE